MRRRLLILCSIFTFLFAGIAGCSPVQTLPSTAGMPNADASGTPQSPGNTQEDTSGSDLTQAPDPSAEPSAEAAPDPSAAPSAEATPAQTQPADAAEPSGQDSDHKADPAQNGSGLISEAKATEIAWKDAGVKEADVTGLRVRLETDDGRQQYEVDFYVENQEYDYDIDAVKGTVLSKDMDIDNDFRQDAAQGTNDSQNTQNPNAQDAGSPAITRDQAIDIALGEVKGALPSDVRIHLDSDDGRQIYEGSILYNEMEYDFEIDAASGTILEWEAESIYD